MNAAFLPNSATGAAGRGFEQNLKRRAVFLQVIPPVLQTKQNGLSTGMMMSHK